jgi:hypothetical protein
MSGSSVGSVGWGALSRAAALTPVAGVWADFVVRGGRALVDVDVVSGDLAGALSRAASAYVLADDETASSMGVGG